DPGLSSRLRPSNIAGTTFEMETLRGFPYPPATDCARQSRASSTRLEIPEVVSGCHLDVTIAARVRQRRVFSCSRDDSRGRNTGQQRTSRAAAQRHDGWGS